LRLNMSETPIFDSLTHPCFNGSWMGNAMVSNTFPALLMSMKEANVDRALCISQRKVDPSTGYTEYSTLVRSISSNLFPVIIPDYNEITDDVQAYVRDVKDSGYVAIKIHPRISKIDLCDRKCIALIQEASEAGLPLMICTYF